MEHKWFAVQVVPHREFVISAVLQAKGYELFLPEYSVRSGGIRQIRKVLFPGYLFCRNDGSAAGRIVTTPGVMRIVGCGNKPSTVPDAEIDSIRRIMQSGAVRYPWTYIPDRSNVEIASGPLAGLRGVVLGSGIRPKLIVSIHLLNRSIAAELDCATSLVSVPQPVFVGRQRQ